MSKSKSSQKIQTEKEDLRLEFPIIFPSRDFCLSLSQLLMKNFFVIFDKHENLTDSIPLTPFFLRNKNYL